MQTASCQLLLDDRQGAKPECLENRLVLAKKTSLCLEKTAGVVASTARYPRYSMPTSWSAADWRALGEGRYRGVVRALPADVNSDADAEASGTALSYHLRVRGADGGATQSIRVTHRQSVWVEVELRRSQRRDAGDADATVRFHSATDVATVGQLVVLPERVEISGEAGGRHFVLRSAPFAAAGRGGRARWEEALSRGRLPQQRLEGWAHALHSSAAVPYAVDVGADGDAVEEVTVPYVEEQAVDVRAFPAPLSSRFDHRRVGGDGEAMLIAARVRNAAGWPEGWAHCVGHLDVDGVWCKLVVWDGGDAATVPRWLPPASTAAERELELSGDSALIHADARGEFSFGSGSGSRLLGDSSSAFSTRSGSRRRRLRPSLSRNLSSRDIYRSTLGERSLPYRAAHSISGGSSISGMESYHAGGSTPTEVAVDCCAADGGASSPSIYPARSALRALPASQANNSHGRLVTARPRRSPSRRGSLRGSGDSDSSRENISAANLCMADPARSAGTSPRRGRQGRGPRSSVAGADASAARRRGSSRSADRNSNSNRSAATPSLLEASGRMLERWVEGWDTPRWRVDQRRQRRQQRGGGRNVGQQEQRGRERRLAIGNACAAVSSDDSDEIAARASQAAAGRQRNATGVAAAAGEVVSSDEETREAVIAAAERAEATAAAAAAMATPGCFSFLNPIVNGRGRRASSSSSWEAALGISKEGHLHQALRIVSSPWRGGSGSGRENYGRNGNRRSRRRGGRAAATAGDGRPMTGYDAACAGGILALGGIFAIRVAKRVLVGRS
jgi:hypothetical protein